MTIKRRKQEDENKYEKLFNKNLGKPWKIGLTTVPVKRVFRKAYVTPNKKYIHMYLILIILYNIEK